VVPLPLLVAEVVLGTPSGLGLSLAGPLVLGGLALRAWGVGHLGSRSRTRTDAAWELVRGGPFARLRNPLYVANGLIWIGVGLVCGWPWSLGWLGLLAVHYSLVVRWEEQHLRQALGAPYVAYLEEVPRWLPLGEARAGGSWSRAEVLRGERSTGVAVGAVLLVLGARLWVG